MNKELILKQLAEDDNIFKVASSLLRDRLYSQIDIAEANEILAIVYDLLEVQAIANYRKGHSDATKIYE